MINIKKLPESYLLYLGLSVALWLGYIYLTFTAPINESTNTFNLSYWELMALKLSIVVPFFIIWVIGIFAATGITRYISTIKDSPEEKGFSRIQGGVMILLLGLSVGALLGAIRPFLIGDPNAVVILAVIVNYVNVFLPLVAFGYFFDGANNLLRLVKKPEGMLLNVLPVVLVTCAAVFYAWVVFSNPDRQLGLGPNRSGALYLSDTMIVLTLMIPYVVTWALGLLASVRLAHYRNSVQGTIYRTALSWLTRGLLFTIILSIIFQGLRLLNEFFATANLQAILIIIYIILALIAVGYVFLWLGARNLRKIETVL